MGWNHQLKSCSHQCQALARRRSNNTGAWKGHLQRALQVTALGPFSFFILVGKWQVLEPKTTLLHPMKGLCVSWLSRFFGQQKTGLFGRQEISVIQHLFCDEGSGKIIATIHRRLVTPNGGEKYGNLPQNFWKFRFRNYNNLPRTIIFSGETSISHS